ncbi:hypothetical protein SDC9_89968 [bioreactor metagenome]|uniref:Uncharacterized protein n=1 Tax=bioreactor metagenome TaxID=1076179 RepID=A0A644ZQX9_9ZZZZ
MLVSCSQLLEHHQKGADEQNKKGNAILDPWILQQEVSGKHGKLGFFEVTDQSPEPHRTRGPGQSLIRLWIDSLIGIGDLIHRSTALCGLVEQLPQCRDINKEILPALVQL